LTWGPLKNKISWKNINQILDLSATQLIQLKQEQSSLIHTNKSFQNNDKENQVEIKKILELHQSSQHASALVTGMTICRSIAKIKKARNSRPLKILFVVNFMSDQ
jgi:hypothetical protein